MAKKVTAALVLPFAASAIVLLGVTGSQNAILDGAHNGRMPQTALYGSAAVSTGSAERHQSSAAMSQSRSRAALQVVIPHAIVSLVTTKHGLSSAIATKVGSTHAHSHEGLLTSAHSVPR